MNVVDQHEVAQLLAGTIVAGEVSRDADGLTLYYDDGRIVILTGVILAFVGRINGRTLQ